MAITNFPNDAVCYILDDIPGVGEFQGSGVIIGPHTILTASHLLWSADVGQSADKVSVYPGYSPNGSNYNPPGALGGTQAIHFMRVANQGELISSKSAQSDYAVIDTSVDLSRYGQFALDPHFKGGDVIVNGYPAIRNGAQQGEEKTVSTNPYYSDLDTANLNISAGSSGGPIWDNLYSNGTAIPAVAGLVSTAGFGPRITNRKIETIGHWVLSDSALWSGGSPPQGTVPQLDGTTATPAFAYQATAGVQQQTPPVADAPMGGQFATLVDILNRTQSAGSDASLVASSAAASSTLADPSTVAPLPAATAAHFSLSHDLKLSV
jgi:V8-like Glu-specific endopeptidase